MFVGLKQRGILFTEASDAKLFCASTSDNQFLFVCGASNNSFQIYNTEKGIYCDIKLY